MSRRKPDERQMVADVDTRERSRPAIARISMRERELGSWAGLHQGKNVFVDLCDRCHEPGIKLGERWYHEQPCDSQCTLQHAPRPAFEAMRRLLEWYRWCQAQSRAYSHVELERARRLEQLIHPMTSYFLDQIARPDRRHLPTISESRMIHSAMVRDYWDHLQDPIELEDWTKKPCGKS